MDIILKRGILHIVLYTTKFTHSSVQFNDFFFLQIYRIVQIFYQSDLRTLLPPQNIPCAHIQSLPFPHPTPDDYLIYFMFLYSCISGHFK